MTMPKTDLSGQIAKQPWGAASPSRIGQPEYRGGWFQTNGVKTERSKRHFFDGNGKRLPLVGL